MTARHLLAGNSTDCTSINVSLQVGRSLENVAAFGTWICTTGSTSTDTILLIPLHNNSHQTFVISTNFQMSRQPIGPLKTTIAMLTLMTTGLDARLTRHRHVHLVVGGLDHDDIIDRRAARARLAVRQPMESCGDGFGSTNTAHTRAHVFNL